MALTSLDPLLNVYSAETRKEIVQILLKRGFFKEEKGWAVEDSPVGTFWNQGIIAFLYVVISLSTGAFGVVVSSLFTFNFVISGAIILDHLRVRKSVLVAKEGGLEWHRNGRAEWALPWDELDKLPQTYRFFTQSRTHTFLQFKAKNRTVRFPLSANGGPYGMGAALFRVICPPPRESSQGIFSGLIISGLVLVAGCILVRLLGVSEIQPRLRLWLMYGLLSTLWLAAAYAGHQLWRGAQYLRQNRRDADQHDLPAETYANWIERALPGYQLAEGAEYAVPEAVLNALKSTPDRILLPTFALYFLPAAMASLNLLWVPNLDDTGFNLTLYMLFGFLWLAVALLCLWPYEQGKPNSRLRATYTRLGRRISMKLPSGRVKATTNNRGGCFPRTFPERNSLNGLQLPIHPDCHP